MHTRPVQKGNGDEDSVCWSFPNAKFLRFGETGTMGRTSWGSWKKWEYCPNNGRVVAFRKRVDLYSKYRDGKKWDNTGLNSIKLLCEEDDQTILSNAGWFGDWTEWKYCPQGEYMVGGQLKSLEAYNIADFGNTATNMFGHYGWEEVRPADELAALDFKMMCSGGGNIVFNLKC